MDKMNLFKLIFLSLLFSLLVNAQEEILMKKGESKTITTASVITAVFVSDPKVIDFKIINQNKVVMYATDIGIASIKVFGNKKADLLVAMDVYVDSYKKDLDKISKMIEAKLPGSSIKIEKLTLPEDQGYIISGEVPDEGSRDAAYNMAAIALNLEIERLEKKPVPTSATSQRINSEGQNDDEPLKFLDRFQSDLLIDRLKIALSNQVNVKLIVADIEKSLISKLGFDFTQGSGIIALPLVQAGNFVSGFSWFNFFYIFEALNDDQAAKILAQPNLSVLSGESAQFSVLGQYTPISNSVTISGQAVSSPGAAKDYGISLTIQPKVFSKDKIIVRISQEVSNIQSIIERNGATAANLKKRSTESVIQVADGESFIIGGLLDEKDNENITSVPFLGDIPVLGALFRKTNINRSKQELIVIATVTLAKPVNKEIALPNYQIRNLAESFFALPYKKPDQVSDELENFMQNIGFVN